MEKLSFDVFSRNLKSAYLVYSYETERYSACI